MSSVVRTLVLCLGLLLAAPLAANDAPRLTESDVDALVSRLTAAARNLDVDALTPLFARDARFEMVVNGGGGSQLVRMNLAEYLQSLQQTKPLVTSYDYRASRPDIRVAADGASAEVRLTVDEVTEMGGHRLSSRTESVVRVRATPDGPRIQMVKGETDLKM